MARAKSSKSAPQWPADSVERWPIERLAAYARNAKKHSDGQVADIARSITEYGFTVPVLAAEDGTIIAGHGRVLAAQTLGIGEIPVIVARGWSDAKRRAYTILDNRLGETGGGWDEELLRIEMIELQDDGVDIGLLGFDSKELGRLLNAPGDGLTDPDEAPAIDAAIVSQVGDIWTLGAHRLICGDATDGLVVEALLSGAEPHLMVTDPPYGVEYDAEWRRTARNGDGSLLSTGRGRAVGKVANDARADWRAAWGHFRGDVAYVWHAGRHASAVQCSIEAAGFEIRCQLVWAKQQFAIGRGDYHWMHEPCWYAVRKGRTGHWQGDRKQTTLWQIDKPQKSETGHSTQKPIECMRRPIENNSEPGDAVYEPFSGSGTTIIAAEMTGRRCFAIEISPAYVDVAVRRWQAYTGKAATLSDGRSFDEVAADRIDEAA